MFVVVNYCLSFNSYLGGGLSDLDFSVVELLVPSRSRDAVHAKLQNSAFLRYTLIVFTLFSLRSDPLSLLVMLY